MKVFLIAFSFFAINTTFASANEQSLVKSCVAVSGLGSENSSKFSLVVKKQTINQYYEVSVNGSVFNQAGVFGGYNYNPGSVKSASIFTADLDGKTHIQFVTKSQHAPDTFFELVENADYSYTLYGVDHNHNGRMKVFSNNILCQ